MADPNLKTLLAPASIAIIGASEAPGKVGTTVLANLKAGGFAGPLYPINAHRDSVQGLPAFRTITELSRVPELAIVCTPAATVPGLVHQCGQAGVSSLLILTAGFRELGESGRVLQEEVKAAQLQYPGLRIIGPNCLGIIAPWADMNASFAVGMPQRGSVAFLSQSGALCTAILDWALDEGIGFSHFISLGNQLDVGFADLLDYLVDDPHTSAAILYVEAIFKANYFLEAAGRFAARKPLVAYKAGRYAQSAHAATSHTGAMAGVDAVYQAAFDRAGIVRVFDLSSMFECAELLARHPQPVGPRLAIVTNAGGPGVMATDALLAERGELAELSPETVEQLHACLPPSWSRGNPVDVLGDADPARFANAVRIVSGDDRVDTILALLTPQAMTDPTATARMVVATPVPAGKTLLAAWMGGQLMRAGKEILQAAGIPTFETPEQAIGGLNHLTAYSRARQRLDSAGLQPSAPLAGEEAREHLSTKVPKRLLSQFESKRLLEQYQIPVTPIVAADTSQRAMQAATNMGYPVVLKIHSPQITHKTEVDGVALNLQNATEVARGFDRLVETAHERRPDAQILGVTVEPMISMASSMELIVGMKRDPVFGPVIMVGYGGIAAELFRDRALELPPLNEAIALRMLQSLRCWPLLAGYRGRPAVDVPAVVAALCRFSELVAHELNMLEADINPLLVGPGAVIALDARFVRSGAAAPTT